MKRNRLFIVLCFVLTSSVVSFAQLSDYNFLRPITGVKDQWHRIELPDDVYGEISPSLKDIRIIRIRDIDTLEIPYVIKKPKAEIEVIAFEIINKTRNDNGYYYTFKVGPQKSVDNIDLDFGQDNFDLKIALEGSQDQKEWFSIVEGYRIVSIKNTLTDYQFTTIRFPKSQFEFFRLLVPTSSDPNFKSAGISQQLASDTQNRLYQPNNTIIFTNKENKQTLITGDLDMSLPVSSLKIKVDETIDYYRPIQIQYLRDSFNTDKGWKYNYQSVFRGTLSSLENNEFHFPVTVAQRFKIEVENHDNRPLDIKGFEALGEVKELIVRFDPPQKGQYYLLYGNSNAISPNYDIKNFQSHIPDHPTSLEIGTAEIITHTKVTKTPLFENELWLWSIMLVVIGLLGWFALKMMRGK